MTVLKRRIESRVSSLVRIARHSGETVQRWEQSVSDRRDHEVKLERMPARENLSDAEAALLDEIWREHGSKDQWQLVD